MDISKTKLLLLKFSQAWISCILCMGGGLSLYHATVAAKTGLVGAVGVYITSFIPNSYSNRKSNLAFTFFTTFIGDIIVVPTHYGPVWMEAFLTGGTAVLISLVTVSIRDRILKT
jgi:hypothetical protein